MIEWTEEKLFEVLSSYSIHEKLVRLDRESINVVTGWCKSEPGVRQGCPLSPRMFSFCTYVFICTYGSLE